MLNIHEVSHLLCMLSFESLYTNVTLGGASSPSLALELFWDISLTQFLLTQGQA